MSLLDPTDRDLARKRAREAAEADLLPAAVDAYIKENPTLDPSGYPFDPLGEFADYLFDDDSHLAQWDDDPSPYDGTYSEA